MATVAKTIIVIAALATGCGDCDAASHYTDPAPRADAAADAEEDAWPDAETGLGGDLGDPCEDETECLVLFSRIGQRAKVLCASIPGRGHFCSFACTSTVSCSNDLHGYCEGGTGHEWCLPQGFGFMEDV